MNAMRTTNSIASPEQRSGAAAVEVAVSLPLFLALVFGVIEANNAIFLKEALTAAAYETANVASAVGGTSSVAVQRGNGVLTLLGVSSGTVTVSPAITANTPSGTLITVTCTAPLGSNTPTGWVMGNQTLQAVVVIHHL